MVVVCHVCRDVVHAHSGYLIRHGVRSHGVFHLCAGSGTSYIRDFGNIGARE